MSSSLPSVAVSQWQKPGEVYRIRRFLQASRHRLAKACSTCRKKKLKCDGQKPCSRCKQQNVYCDLIDDAEQPKDLKSDSVAAADGLRYTVDLQQGEISGLEVAPRTAQLSCDRSSSFSNIWQESGPDLLFVDRPVPAPFSYGGHRVSMKPSRHTPLVNPFHVATLMAIGFKQSAAEGLFMLVTPKLRVALDAVAAKMIQSSPDLDSLPRLPEACDLWDGSGILRQVVSYNSVMQYVACNDSFAQFVGAHPEEVAARMNTADLPNLSSEYRMLCFHLLFLLCRFRGIRQFVNYSPVFPAFSRRASPQEPVHFHRITHTFYRDGLINTGAVLTAAEYDAALRLDPTGTSGLIEDAGSASELTGPRLEEERIQCMISTEEGRAKLDALADKLVAAFNLTDAPQTLHPPPFVQSLEQTL